MVRCSRTIPLLNTTKNNHWLPFHPRFCHTKTKQRSGTDRSMLRLRPLQPQSPAEAGAFHTPLKPQNQFAAHWLDAKSYFADLVFRNIAQ